MTVGEIRLTIVYMQVGRCTSTLVNTESTTVLINIFFVAGIGSVTSRDATSTSN